MQQSQITQYDRNKLTRLLTDGRYRHGLAGTSLLSLRRELETAQIVRPTEISPDVVTMNSAVRLVDIESGASFVYELGYPGSADIDLGCVSVLAPLGLAMLGKPIGATLTIVAPSGIRHLRVEEIVYQPEACGDYHL